MIRVDLHGCMVTVGAEGDKQLVATWKVLTPNHNVCVLCSRLYISVCLRSNLLADTVHKVNSVDGRHHIKS